MDAALASLPKVQQEVVVLRYWGGRSEAEVSAELGLKRQAVSMRLSRALANLRRKLGRQGASVPVAVLATFFGERTIEAVPAGLAASIQAACLGTTAASPSVLSITEGAMKAMGLAKAKAVASVVAAVVAVNAGVAVGVTSRWGREKAAAAQFLAVDLMAPVGPEHKPEPLEAAEIIGPRGGLVSAQFVWSGGGIIRASCGPFQGPGKIPAENVTVRYGSLVPYMGYQDRLTLSPPAQAATPQQSVVVAVRVPRHVPAGKYRAEVSGNGQKVPLELTVVRYTLPEDTGKRHCLVDVIQCPLHAAQMHQVEPWSEAHWKVLDEHWKFLGESGLNQISMVVPLIDQSLNGAPCLVDWTKKGDQYTWDYSRVDRYVEIALRHATSRIKSGVPCLINAISTSLSSTFTCLTWPVLRCVRSWPSGMPREAAFWAWGVVRWTATRRYWERRQSVSRLSP